MRWWARLVRSATRRVPRWECVEVVGGVWQVYEGCRRLINHDFMDEWQVAGDGRGGICWAEDVIRGLFMQKIGPQQGSNWRKADQNWSKID
jgi:hypothetical protein